MIMLGQSGCCRSEKAEIDGMRNYASARAYLDAHAHLEILHAIREKDYEQAERLTIALLSIVEDTLGLYGPLTHNEEKLLEEIEGEIGHLLIEDDEP